MIILVLLLLFILTLCSVKTGRNETELDNFYKYLSNEANCRGLDYKRVRRGFISGKMGCPILVNMKPRDNIFSYAIYNNDYIYNYDFKRRFYKDISLDDETNPFNPPLKIENVEGFNIIRDDVLEGGTKQRGLYWLVKYLEKKTDLAYAGPSQGVAQVALGLIAKHFNLNAFMFSAGDRTKLTTRAEALGVSIIQCLYYQDALDKALEYKKEHEITLLPFGLNSPEFIKYLTHALIIAKGNMKDPKRMWVVAGSGVLLNCLYDVFPTTYFFAVQVGKTIGYKEIRSCRTRVFVHPQKFVESAEMAPPYASVENYDAKLWFFVKKYGEPGDYVWNVAG